MIIRCKVYLSMGFTPFLFAVRAAVKTEKYNLNNKYTNNKRKIDKITKNILTNKDKCDILYLTNNKTALQDRREL